MSANTLTILGLLCGMIGSIALGYELLFGYPKHNRMKYEQLRLDNLDKFIADMIHGIDVLASPPYTAEEKTQMKIEFHTEWDPRREKLAAEVYRLSEGHKEISYIAGWLGILMLFLGFGLQIAGTLSK